MTPKEALGLPLDIAASHFSDDGYAVSRNEVRCRKDVADTDLRVIRAEISGSREVILYYAAFRTTAEEN